MPIDHFGIGVPDVDAARAYYDEFMPLVGFVREWDTGYRIVHEPKPFPEYHPHFYATFFLDMHGFMLEAVTYEKVEETNPAKPGVSTAHA